MSRFHVDVFNLSRPSDCQEFEKIKQSVLVDRDGRFEIVDEVGHWDAETGDRRVCLQYLERDSEATERY